MKCGCDAPGLMPIEQAKDMIFRAITPINVLEHCALHDALGRVLSENIVSPINVPAYDNSAMDGYAIRASDLQSTSTLKQIGKSFAGAAFMEEVNEGECVRIMTGAQIPNGSDTVVMQENTKADDLQISFTGKVKQGDAIRPAGDDIKLGSVVLQKGKRISPIDIGLLASLGINKVPVVRRLCVAVFSTGDELLAAGETAREDRIFDSNRPMLIAMLERLGASVIDLGIIADSKADIKAAFEKANNLADCVITSGGVSVGEADYTREILEEYGQIDFWKLAIKPGKPLAFGRLSDSIFFGLPGNPVSSAVTFDQIAAPALAYLAGESSPVAVPLKAVAKSAMKKRPGRTDYQRAYYYADDSGELCVTPSVSQSSGVLSGFSDSNCYAVLENVRDAVSEGESVNILPFSTLVK
ncbi:gephyrin-like molybdotransferase Glp [Glaciecola sp. SC05]|uniref:molybdopterin molybdotransferase MoeA n=1 Tax=Glaciecola sp. SC05 TaxID=1987355 RepID=UPI003527A26D